MAEIKQPHIGDEPNADQHAYDFAKSGDRVELVHFFGTRLTVISGKLNLYTGLKNTGDEVTLQKFVERGAAISPETAKTKVQELIEKITNDEKFGPDRIQEMKEYWFEESNPESPRVVRSANDTIGKLIGTPESPWNPFE